MSEMAILCFVLALIAYLFSLKRQTTIRRFWGLVMAISATVFAFSLKVSTGFLFTGLSLLFFALFWFKQSSLRRSGLALALLAFFIFAYQEGTAGSRPVDPSPNSPTEQVESSTPKRTREKKAKEERSSSSSAPEKAHQSQAESKQDEAHSPSLSKDDDVIIQQRQEQWRTVPGFDSRAKYVTVNHNVPYFTTKELSVLDPFTHFSDLDSLGRVGQAEGVLAPELMPASDRESIQHVKPTGWEQRRYANVPGGWLYNRSHLIGFQLSGENANPQNLMTGTRFFNAEGMLPFENFVASYIEDEEELVRYRITPVFIGRELLARGIYMEAQSLADGGQAVKMNVFIPNHQPGVELNYATGASVGPEGPVQDGELPNLNE